MGEQSTSTSEVSAASVGGTVAAMVVTVVVLSVVAVIVGFLLTYFNYYMSSMRMEAAGFFGAIFGGWAGTYAARASCDAILKAYHKRAVFALIAVLIGLALYAELVIRSPSWSSVTPLAQLAAIGFASWMYFWVGTDLDA